ncbi:MAG: GNAT family N-acetyltransferase [Calothrix sp. SM1_5_4]|nr:GNAT family N-acetyltransferase [Calothrix sp. SM1_5_4]
MPQELLDKLDYGDSTRRNQPFLQDTAKIAFVAEIKGPHDCQIIGFAMGGHRREGPSEYTGELYGIYVLEKYQRSGVGLRLLKRIAQSLYGGVHRSMLVWVLKGNRAVGFYEKLGGVVVDEKDLNLGGKNLRELAFGWRNLEGLANQLS